MKVISTKIFIFKKFNGIKINIFLKKRYLFNRNLNYKQWKNYY